jgi:hypothetical protein
MSGRNDEVEDTTRIEIFSAQKLVASPMLAQRNTPEATSLRLRRIYSISQKTCHWHLVVREDNYPTLVAFAFRFGTNFRVTSESHVNDSTFCWRHRFETVVTTA